MSSTTRVAPPRQPPPAPAPQPPPAVVQPPAAPSRGPLARALEDTPGRLRLAALLGVVVCLLFALLGANAFRTRGEALDAAGAGADQLVRVQQIASDLAQADAVVTNAFLLGGNAGTGGLQQFDQYVAAASKGIAEASRAEPGDADALAAVNQSLTRYSAAIASATANNRLGNEVGSAYLRQASQLLRTPTTDSAAMLPTLQSVADTDAQRVDDAFADASRSFVYLVVAGVVVLGALLAVAIWLARTTRRILNVPLTAGTATVLAALILGALVMLGSQSAVVTVRDTHYTATKALAQARIAAFDAKANESLTLVYRGTGQAFETAWKTRFQTALENVTTAGRAGVRNPGSAQLNAWGAVHTAIRASDDAGSWDQAVARATGTGKQDSSTVFAAFADVSKTGLDAESTGVRDGLGSTTVLVLLGWLTLVLGLVAAVLAWRGIAQRLEEYR